jgi:hypothetical protein
MIHRDNRRSYESASAFGQIVHRKEDKGGAPRDFGGGDVDWFVHRARQQTLLRWIEHKQPDHKFEPSQRNSLKDFDRVIRHAVNAPPPGMSIHPDSGVYVLRGPLVVAEKNWRRPVDFGGKQKLMAADGEEELFEFTNREQLYKWMRGLNVCEICGEPAPDARVQYNGRPDGWVHHACADARDPS